MRSTIIITLCCLSLTPAAIAAAPNDGTYHGAIQLMRGETPPCARTGTPRVMTITNNQLTYMHFGDMKFSPDVGPDGSFSGRAFRSTAARGGSYDLKGRVSGGHIEADLSNSQCTYHMSLTRG